MRLPVTLRWPHGRASALLPLLTVSQPLAQATVELERRLLSLRCSVMQLSEHTHLLCALQRCTARWLAAMAPPVDSDEVCHSDAVLLLPTCPLPAPYRPLHTSRYQCPAVQCQLLAPTCPHPPAPAVNSLVNPPMRLPMDFPVLCRSSCASPARCVRPRASCTPTYEPSRRRAQAGRRMQSPITGR